MMAFQKVHLLLELKTIGPIIVSVQQGNVLSCVEPENFYTYAVLVRDSAVL